MHRPNEGRLQIEVQPHPMGSPNVESSRPSELFTELARLVERGLRETKAVDLEALCVLAGRKVCELLSAVPEGWHLSPYLLCLTNG